MLIKPKKRLGQNFLTDKNIQRKLLESYALKATDRILEIGSGYGDLTKQVASRSAFVYALELDTHLCELLKDNIRESPNIKIINQDILKFDFEKIFRDSKEKLKVVGNIPYYISSPIIERLLKYRDNIETILITVQKEFAKRVVSAPGSKEYGSLSCFIQYYAIPRIIFVIKKTCFWPRPKVDSCVLELKIREVPPVKVNDEAMLFKIIRASFNKRRKTLRNSLDGVVSAKKLAEFFQECAINNNVRPEELALKDFACLANQ